MGLFKRNSGSLLGLDVGGGAVRLVELSRPTAEYRVQACGVEPLPPLAGAEASISDAARVGEAIRALRKRVGATAQRAAVAVPDSAVIARTVTMDASLTDEEIEVEAALELDSALTAPGEGEDMATDFEPLGLSLDDPTQVEVLLVACRRALVARLEAAVAKGGLTAAVVDVESHCVERVVAAMRVGDGLRRVAVVHVGAEAAGLLLLDEGRVLFSRQEALVADGRTSALAAADCSPASGTPTAPRPPGATSEQVLTVLERLLRLAPAGQPERLLFAGDSAPLLRQLAEAAPMRVGIASEVAAPFSRMALCDGVAPAESAALLVATGLALRRFEG